jgi:manganese efflux pump family protein
MDALIQLLVISISLALDALSVSVAGGIKTQKAKASDAFKIAVFFGGFQLIMPLIGWSIGVSLQNIFANIDHWVAFFLLLIIGVKMITESFQNKKEKEKLNILKTKTLFFLAIATSIDALIVGVTLDYIRMPLLLSVVCIGVITFILSFIGFLFGKKLGTFFEGKIEILGGIALIGLGIKILIEHL